MTLENKFVREIGKMIENYAITNANQFLDMTLNEDDLEDIEQRIGEPLTRYLEERDQLGDGRKFLVQSLQAGNIKTNQLRELTAFMNDRISGYWNDASEDVPYILQHNKKVLESKCITDWKESPDLCRSTLSALTQKPAIDIFHASGAKKPVLKPANAQEWLSLH